MSMPESDPWLDAKLRNVPLPVGLLSRLGSLADAPQEQLEAALRDVPLPAGLLDRLQQIAVPARRLSLVRLALAASLVTAVTLGVWAVGNLPATLPVALGPAVSELPVPPAADTGLSEAAPALTDDGSPLEAPLATEPPSGAAADLPPVAADPTQALASGVPAAAPYAVPPSQVRPGAASVLAADNRLDPLPELARLAPEPRYGLSPPRVRGYDLLFQLKHGEHPRVAPAAHRQLESTLVPLVTRQDSFERVARLVAAGRLPSAEDVRIEEFLAALDYRFKPPASGRLGLRVAAGRAPGNEPGWHLVQVAVQAAPIVDSAAVHLVALVDSSVSMRAAGGLVLVEQALDRVSRALGPGDAISLIDLGAGGRVLADRVGGRGLVQLRAQLAGLRAAAGSDLPAALAWAQRLSEADQPAGRVQQWVLLSDGALPLSAASAAQARELLAARTASQTRLAVLDLGPADGPGPAAADRLEALATAGRCRVELARSVDTACDRLQELLTGQSQVVAVKTTLQVTFNPKSVALYRLLGHEAVSLTAAAGPDREVELRGGQAATGLLELLLVPGGPDEVARVDLTWTDSGTPSMHRRTHRLTRQQLAPTWSQAPPALWAAAVAAETAEALRQSQYSPPGRGLSEALQLAAQAPPELAERPDFQRLVALARQAEALRRRRAP
jgi:Ca-activated chloride channel family protein